MSINLRFGTIKDLKVLQNLSTELAHSDLPFDKEININWAYTTDGEKYFKEKLERNLCLLVEDNGVIVGYTTFAIKDVPLWRLVRVSELENLFVTEKHRNRGIGKLLMEGYLQWSKKNKVNKICISVFYPNVEAIRFYKQYGLIEYDLNLEMAI